MPGGNLVVIGIRPALSSRTCTFSNANPMLLNDVHRTVWLRRATLVSFARANVRVEGALAMLQTPRGSPSFFLILPVESFSLETEARHLSRLLSRQNASSNNGRLPDISYRFTSPLWEYLNAVDRPVFLRWPSLLLSRMTARDRHESYTQAPRIPLRFTDASTPRLSYREFWSEFRFTE